MKIPCASEGNVRPFRGTSGGHPLQTSRRGEMVGGPCAESLSPDPWRVPQYLPPDDTGRRRGWRGVGRMWDTAGWSLARARRGTKCCASTHSRQ